MRCDHIEVAILMKQSVAALDAKGRDQKIDRLADRDSFFAQQPRVAGGCDGDRIIDHGFDHKTAQGALQASGVTFVASTAQNLEQNQISDDDARR